MKITSKKPLVMTALNYHALESDYTGICTKCGYEQQGVEPDAMYYTCEDCGADKVIGLENMLIMGLLEIDDSSDN
jgi:Zn finger protein HypA/HybF involved in hydrogenase expression